MQLPYEIEDVKATPTLVALLQETALFLWKEWPSPMEAVYHDSTVFSLRGECPHCSHASVFTIATGIGMDNLSPTNPTVTRMIAGMKCQGCKKYILGIVTHRQDETRFLYEAHYPLGVPDDSVAAEIPMHIQPDFKEALRCLSVNAYNATAEMCRRAVEASCINLGAPRELKVLEEKIDWLEAKRLITPFLRDVAHKIRLGGNRAAHPPENEPVAPSGSETPESAETGPITIITEEHAKAIVTFTREFFHHVYVVPKQLDKYDFSKPKAPKP